MAKIYDFFTGKPLPPRMYPEDWKAQIHDALLEDAGDFILLGWVSMWPFHIHSLYISKTGPRHIYVFFEDFDPVTSKIAGCTNMGRAVRRRINWNDHRYTWTDACHLIAPNPDRRREYLAANVRQEAAL